MNNSDKSSGKGKAVVKEEPVTEDAEQEIWLVKKTAADQGRRRTRGQLEEGSSSLAVAHNQPPASMEAIAPPVPTMPVPVPELHGGNNNLFLFLKNIMQQCAAALCAGNVMAANAAVHYMLPVATNATAGDPGLRRVALVFAEALAHRAMRSLLPGLAWALQLQPPQPLGTTDHAARESFAVLCPLVRIAGTAANHAILEALGAEHHVHVVDLGGAAPAQWAQLIRTFAARPGGPPCLRLTVVNEQDEFLSRAAAVVTQEAVRLHVPLLFIPVRSHIDRFAPPSLASLGIVHCQGEALVITSTLQLHRLIADELPAPAHNGNNLTKADVLLRVLGDVTPRLMVLMEQEADHNDAALANRVANAFDYYTALFRDLEVGQAGPRLLLRDEVMDVVANDGVLRRERHEKVARWALRMQMAGFEPANVSNNTLYVAAKLTYDMTVHCNEWDFGIQRGHNGSIVLYSHKVPIFSVSTWKPVHKTG